MRLLVTFLLSKFLFDFEVFCLYYFSVIVVLTLLGILSFHTQVSDAHPVYAFFSYNVRYKIERIIFLNFLGDLCFALSPSS